VIFDDEATWFSKIQFISNPNRGNATFTIPVILFREKFLCCRMDKEFVPEERKHFL
jgi:hypothetical protein